MSEMKGIMAERGSNYGDYTEQAKLSQALKELVITAIVGRGVTLEPYMAESLELICMKLSRIGMGDVYHEDSWRDIEGYACLAADRVKATNTSMKLAAIMEAGIITAEDAREAAKQPVILSDVYVEPAHIKDSTEKAGESSSATEEQD